MKRRSAFFALTMTLAVVTVTRSGHELPVYPSFYPHEIVLAAVTPERAAELLSAGKIQAYVGAAPRFAGTPPATVQGVDSLGSFVVVRIHPSSSLAKDAKSSCAVGEYIIRDLSGKAGDLIVHPYPVTPFHGDYLHHFDLAEAAKARILGSRDASSGSAIAILKVKATTERVRALVRPEWRAEGPDWDAELAEISAAELIASTRYSMNGWLGPAWLRSGWFSASLLLGERMDDEDLVGRVRSRVRRLQTSNFANSVERINLERSLVSTLAADCFARVVGYTLRREYFSTVFEAGVENIAHDAVTGFNSPMFIRTVKLRDFPWNGWLSLGMDGAPRAAWNPVAGFTDEFGRLMWSAVGDPVLIPSPNESAWMFNRIADVQSSAAQ
jgi:hypothetical protein